jgi:ABC-type uncharacterized transport system substrate-binding protein
MKKTLMLLILLFCFSPYAFSEEKNIFVIESYHAGYPWDISYKKGLESVIGDKYRLVYFEMDTKRVPQSEYEKKAEEAWQQYAKVKPVLVILGDDNALKYLAPKFANTGTPVVYLGINRNPKDYGAYGLKNMTGVLERPLFNQSVAFLKKIIQPSPKKILVLFDSGTTSQSSVAEAFKGHTTLPVYNITVQLKLIGNVEEWKKTVLNAKKDGFDAAVIGLYHTLTDDQGSHTDSEELLKWTVANSPVPPFGFWDFSVGSDKTIGGFVLFGKSQGEAAGKIALKILADGKSPDKIRPVLGDMGRFLFSKSQLKKWGLSLPDDIAKAAEYTD